MGTGLQGRFVVDEVVSRGAMARVSRARLATVDRPVLLMELHPPGTLSPVERRALADRFLEQARCLAGLRRMGVAPPVDAGATSEGATYVAFDRPDLSGCEPLGQPSRRREWRSACSLAIQLCRALSAAEERGYALLRLHPEHVWVDKTGEVLWTALDACGLARSLGLPPETADPRVELDAPETAGSGKIDFRRALVFSISSWLYRAVAGSAAPAPGEALRAGRRPEPLWAVAPQCPAALDDLLQRGLDPAPGHRFRSVAELAAALAALPGLELDPSPAARAVTTAVVIPAADDLRGLFWERAFPALCVTVAAAALGYLAAVLVR